MNGKMETPMLPPVPAESLFCRVRVEEHDFYMPRPPTTPQREAWSDARRVQDPTLQLDVDLMILEYLLFQTTKAVFTSLSNGSTEIDSQLDQRRDTQTTATTTADAAPSAADAVRLLTIFDSFIHLFNRQHSGHVHSPEFLFGLDILEFLVLLSRRWWSRPPPTNSQPHLPRNTTPKLRRETAANLKARRRWLAAREQSRQEDRPKPPQTNGDMTATDVTTVMADDVDGHADDDKCVDDVERSVIREVEDGIYAAWKDAQRLNGGTTDSQVLSTQKNADSLPTGSNVDIVMTDAAAAAAAAGQTQSDHTSTSRVEDSQEGGAVDPGARPWLFDLVPRFLDISANVAGLLGGEDPNESWMEMAGEFMLQAGLESLKLGLNAIQTNPGDERHPRLEDCFAWGYVDVDASRAKPAADDESEAVQDSLFNELFSTQNEEEDENGPPGRRVETPLWLRVRTRYLSEFSIAHEASDQSQTWRLDRLADKYPLAPFQESLVVFLRYAWDMLYRDLDCKPVLVQIEEGTFLAGEGHAEFDHFLTRVGLRKDADGVVKMKL
jgi:hypothetical protein